MEAKLRSYKHNMYISGTGCILMGIWACLKSFMTIFLDPTFKDTFKTAETDPIYFYVGFIFLTVVVLIFVFWIHYYIGRCAMKEARGKKQGRLYLILCFVLAAINIWGMQSYKSGLDGKETLDVLIASMLVDVTLLVILFDIVYSHFMIKKLSEERAAAGIS